MNTLQEFGGRDGGKIKCFTALKSHVTLLQQQISHILAPVDPTSKISEQFLHENNRNR